MKLGYLIAILAFSSVSLADVGALHCKTTRNKEVVTFRMGDPVDDFVDYCEGAFFHGEICFTGPRKQALIAIEQLEDADFLGDEMEIRDIHYVGRDQIGYEVYDQPNEWVGSDNKISRCPADYFKK